MYKNDIKVFEFSSGETDWVIAENLEQAYLLLQSELEYEESLDDTTSREVPYSELKTLIFYDNGTEQTFQEVYDAFIQTQYECPYYLAGTMFI